MGFKVQKEVRKGVGASGRSTMQDVPWIVDKPKKKGRKLWQQGRRQKVKGLLHRRQKDVRLRGNPDPH